VYQKIAEKYTDLEALIKATETELEEALGKEMSTHLINILNNDYHIE